MIRCVGRCLGLAVWTASSESRMCLVPVHEGQRRVGKSRLLTAPPWSPAGGRRVQSSVCGRRAQGLAGRTRRPGVAVAEGSGSSERRRRRVVAAVAARATCIDGLLTGGAPMRRLPVGNPSVLAPAEGLRPVHGRHRIRARYSDFAICSCGGISQICQWYRVCDAGALRAEPLATLYILRGHKTTGSPSRQARHRCELARASTITGTPPEPPKRLR